MLISKIEMMMNELLNQWSHSQILLQINNTVDQDFVSNEEVISCPLKVHATNTIDNEDSVQNLQQS